MKDVPVVEAQTRARQAVILVRVVLEQGPDIQRPLGAGTHQGAGDVLLQLVQPRLVPDDDDNDDDDIDDINEDDIDEDDHLVPVVLVRFVLDTQLHRASGALQNLQQKKYQNLGSSWVVLGHRGVILWFY